jgi:DNA helicase II / ATP-dependent DNA helicase PcrA
MADCCIVLTPKHKQLLETDGYILVLGGPGCGKTSIALLKADHEIQRNRLKQHQRILFLSFARATIARVAQQCGKLKLCTDRSLLEINTYHGFAWNLLRSHGYLLNSQTIRLLPPPDAAAKLSTIDRESQLIEKRRLFYEEGLLHFDLFAVVATELLSRSHRLQNIISDAYPLIILDEFQDTNSDEWKMIQALGKASLLIALGDADQRIYEFRGADPKRIGEFISAYSPTQFDFGTENNRSNGTDIAMFGNDLLTAANKIKAYSDVAVVRYGFYRGRNAHFALKTTLIQGINRQVKNGNRGWSIAVLVPTKRLMLAVSDYLSSKSDGLPAISHDVALDAEAPALAAILIAGLLEGSSSKSDITQRLIRDLCVHIRGRRGSDAPRQSDLELAASLEEFVVSGSIKGKKRRQLVSDCLSIVDQRISAEMSGDPWEDWLSIRRLLSSSVSDAIRAIEEDAKYLRLLHKGAILRARLGEIWRDYGSYVGAAIAVRDALLQEHFSASTMEWRGVNVMTMHKSKGKEFDEVFIYEGSHQGRIVRANASDNEVAQARLALRVAVTRAVSRTTILSPKSDMCVFL